MRKDDLKTKYFEWLCQLVYSKKCSRRLLAQLHSIEFTYILDMDSNREEDGVNLRYRFGSELDIHDSIVAAYLDDCPCSVLEMMVALAVRCEEHIMENSKYGNRTSLWFRNMINSLGLGNVTDYTYDERYVDDVIFRFLNRDYDSDGAGGLFTIENCRHDLRDIDIWYQLNWYLDYYYQE